jgi:hypothetical protein
MSNQAAQIDEVFLRGRLFFECRVPPLVDEFLRGEYGYEPDYSIDSDQRENKAARVEASG